MVSDIIISWEIEAKKTYIQSYCKIYNIVNPRLGRAKNVL